MSEHIAKTLADVQEAISKLEREVAQKKELANQLAGMGGLPLPYPVIETAEAPGSAVIARDAFVGQTLHSAMRLYLEKRRLTMPNSAPATVNEMFRGIQDGGYTFETKNEDNAKRNIRIVLGKNTNTFHRVGDAFGLLSWYGPKALKKSRKATGSEAEDGAEPDADDGGAEAEGQEEEES